MVFWKKKVTVSAPEMQKIPYKGGSIIINPQTNKPYPDGESPFWLKVSEHLEFIESIHGLGDIVDFLSAQTKTITIFYDTVNYIRTGAAGMAELSYQFFNRDPSPDAEKWPRLEGTTPYLEFADELKRTMTKAGYYSTDLARRLLNDDLYSWQGGRRETPFKEGTDKLTRRQLTEKIDDWRAGKMLPSIAQFDVLSKAVESFLKDGGGCNCMVGYDPLNDENRPAHVGLYHELVHAYYSVQGIQLGREDSASEFNGGRHFEQMSVGLPPHDAKRFSENKYRAALHPAVVRRAVYP